MDPADEELLAQLLAGSEASFTALYRRRHPAVYRFALQMTGKTEIAEDVTQETFLALLRKGASFDPARGTVASYLFGIARNQVWKRLDPVLSAEDCEEADPAASALDQLSRRETAQLVRQAVLSLPPAYREVVVLCDLNEASYEEAAAALGCPVGTIRSRLSRARGLLAQKLSAVEANPCKIRS